MAVQTRTGSCRVYPKPFDPEDFSFLRRLKEIDMFFDRRDPVHQTTRRLARRLDRARIPYAIMGAMAVNAHGARRTTDDVDLLINSHGLERFRERFVGRWYEPVAGRPRRFVDRQSGVTIDVLVTGGRPGFGQPTPLRFPEPRGAARVIEKIRYLKLPRLIELKLAARRHYDFGDVVFLIRVHDLDESYLKHLHPAVHKDFLECLEEKRREDEYEARE
jgi:hypothetical protein